MRSTSTTSDGSYCDHRGQTLMTLLFRVEGGSLGGETRRQRKWRQETTDPKTGNSLLFRTTTAKVLSILLAGLVIAPRMSAVSNKSTADSLIPEAREGERRIHRPAGTGTGTVPFLLKVDPKNSGSKCLCP